MQADGAERETIDLVWTTDDRVIQVRAHRDVRPPVGAWAMILTLSDARHESRSRVAEPAGLTGVPGPEANPTDLLPRVVAATLGDRVVASVVRDVGVSGASEMLQVIAERGLRAMILRANRRAPRPDQLAGAR